LFDLRQSEEHWFFQRRRGALPNDGTLWQDRALGFSAHFADHDIFAGTIDHDSVEQFVIRYSVDAQTFFDNNFGQNYRLGQALVGENVVLGTAAAHQGTEAGGGFVFTTSWLEGEILVNNLSFVKFVGVRVSLDGGGTWDDTAAAFSGQNTADNRFIAPAEVRKFKTPEFNLNLASPEFRFAVFYQNGAAGEMFWDSNFGQDYHVSKAAGSTVG
jgi:hypothetical protein